MAGYGDLYPTYRKMAAIIADMNALNSSILGCYSLFFPSVKTRIRAAKAKFSANTSAADTKQLGKQVGNVLYESFKKECEQTLKNLDQDYDAYKNALSTEQKQQAYQSMLNNISGANGDKAKICAAVKGFYGSTGPAISALLKLATGGRFENLTASCPTKCNRGPNNGQFYPDSIASAAQTNISKCQGFVSYLKSILSSEISNQANDGTSASSYTWKLSKSGVIANRDKVIERRPDVVAYETILNKINDYSNNLKTKVDTKDIKSDIENAINASSSLSALRSYYNQIVNQLNGPVFTGCQFEGTSLKQYILSGNNWKHLTFRATQGSNLALFKLILKETLATDFKSTELPNTVKEFNSFLSLFDGFKDKVETLLNTDIIPKLQSLLSKATGKTGDLTACVDLLSSALTTLNGIYSGLVADCPASSGTTSGSYGGSSGTSQL